MEIITMKKLILCFLLSSLLLGTGISASADKITKFDGKKVTFSVDKAGTYSIIAADFNGSSLQRVEVITQTLSKGTHSVTPKISLAVGDKIMLWSDLYGMKALCAAHPAGSLSIEGDSGIF